MMINDEIFKLFEISAEEVKILPEKPTDDKLLELYALYKQAKFGNNNNPKPAFFNFKEKAKWNAWENKKGKGKRKSCKEYIKLVEDLKKNI
jgi:diazepam-binding inhibitor (GABA receptor modulator, acyl-CoA-binding protein)